MISISSENFDKVSNIGIGSDDSQPRGRDFGPDLDFVFFKIVIEGSLPHNIVSLFHNVSKPVLRPVGPLSLFQLRACHAGAKYFPKSERLMQRILES